MISRHDSAYFDEEISTAQRRCFHFYFWWSEKMVSKTSLNFLVSIILPRHQRRGVTFFFVLEFFFLCCCYCCWFNTLFSFRELKIYWRWWLVFVAIFIAFLPVSRWRWRSYYLWVLWHLYILYGNFMKIRFWKSKSCINFRFFLKSAVN